MKINGLFSVKKGQYGFDTFCDVDNLEVCA